jgi:V/A-type H+-transporting ATPase subunit I
MSIVKMKRLRLIGLRSEQDELLARLLHLGCVEVTETDDKLADPRWADLLKRETASLGDAKAQANALNGALEALRKYAPEKSGLFVKRSDISEAEFLSARAREAALDTASQINQRVQSIAQSYTQENRASARRAGLVPWSGLDLPLEVTETEATKLTYFTLPAAAVVGEIQTALAQAAPMAELIQAGSDKELQYFLLVCHKQQQQQAMDALKPFSVSTVSFKDFTGTPAENIKNIDRELARLTREREDLAKEIAGYSGERKALQISLDRVNQEVAKEAVRERTLTDGTVVFLEGWASGLKLDALQEELKHFTCAYELADPAQEETPPTQLQNPKWMRCINMVTEMYSLPAYDGIDPNPLIFLWYIFFFGFMFADVAYGIIIFAVCQALIKIYKPKGYVFYLGRYLGISTAFCGLFVGGFFGNVLEVIYDTFLQMDMPGWMQAFCDGIVVNPIQDPMTVLILAIAIGCVQLLMGQCIHIYMGFRDGAGVDALLDVVPWWVVFAGIACVALTGNPWVLVAGALILLLTQGRHAPTIPGKIMGGLKSWYDITSWLSDVLSYARLMALMLATSVIAMVFNTLGALVGPSVLGVIVFVVVFLIGHVFNIGVNLIGTYVHAARLQYLEYFGKFYKEGGIPFRPLRYDTKYVDIVETKEEM